MIRRFMIVAWVLLSLNFGVLLLAAEVDQIVRLKCKYDDPDNLYPSNRHIIMTINIDSKLLNREEIYPKGRHSAEYTITSVTPDWITATMTNMSVHTLEINRITGSWIETTLLNKSQNSKL